MKTLLIISLAVIISACNNEKDIRPSAQENMQMHSTDAADKGKLLLEQKCYSCHNPKSESHKNSMAPPLAAIQKKYKNTYKTKSEFVSKFSSFILHPTEEKAIEPIHKFGLMPNIILTKDEALQISNYVYHNPLPYPAWLPQHWEEKHKGKF